MPLFNNDKFYRKQFHRHLESIYPDDGLSIQDINERHATLLTKAKRLQALQPLLENIGSMSQIHRSADGAFIELNLYRRHIEQFKHYISNLPIYDIPDSTEPEQERIFQLELTNRLLQLDTFYKSMIQVKNEREAISGAIRGEKELSLADMQLI